MVHESRTSRSLLAQLGRKDEEFFDSTPDLDPNRLTDHWGLLVGALWRQMPSWSAPLDDTIKPGRWTDFETWWNKVVFRDAMNREISRRGLVLAVADQDGGAHVDPTIDVAYGALSRQNSFGWRRVIDGKDEPAGPPHLDAVRQVAHEVLKTLIPSYTKRPRPFPAPRVLFGNISITPESPPVPSAGRNDPCPCGSGRKYKKCHGAPKTG